MRQRARALYIVEYGARSKSHHHNRLNSQTKQIPIFPVEISYKEPTVVLPVKKIRKRRSTRATGENPRAKGTNPRAKK